MPGDLEDDAWYKGVVVRGDGRGRSLGFATANIVLDGEFTRPEDGVYAGRVKLGRSNSALNAAVHVGPRPTFKDVVPTIEVHILDFDNSDLYGTRVSFSLYQRLRGVEKYVSAEALSEALKQDCQQAEQVLSNLF